MKKKASKFEPYKIFYGLEFGIVERWTFILYLTKFVLRAWWFVSKEKRKWCEWWILFQEFSCKRRRLNSTDFHRKNWVEFLFNISNTFPINNMPTYKIRWFLHVSSLPNTCILMSSSFSRFVSKYAQCWLLLAEIHKEQKTAPLYLDFIEFKMCTQINRIEWVLLFFEYMWLFRVNLILVCLHCLVYV